MAQTISPINTALRDLFRAHEVDATIYEDWVVFATQSMAASGSVAREIKQPKGLTVQLDVKFVLSPQQIILESFAGMGRTWEQAVGDALSHFAANSFHVLRAAFLKPDDVDDPHVARKEWLIGGSNRPVIIGDIGLRGRPPVQGERMVAWFRQFEAKLKTRTLPPGTHWLRLYYGQAEGEAIACEVLLDNAPWEEMQQEMAGVDWPRGTEFYSVRVFMVLF